MIVPSIDGCSSPYAWSPDGKWLAVMATPCQAPDSRLWLVAIPSGAARCIDTLAVFADYEFDWSPDSRWLAVVRPTAVEPLTEAVSDADLWIFGLLGRGCVLARTPDHVERHPFWITGHSLLVDRQVLAKPGAARTNRIVIELREE
jgi:WD40 repeat protein